MDDPLSALDLQVGEYIVRETILNKFRKENKTVVMVTHALNYLKYFDYVYLVEKGEIRV